MRSAGLQDNYYKQTVASKIVNAKLVHFPYKVKLRLVQRSKLSFSNTHLLAIFNTKVVDKTKIWSPEKKREKTKNDVSEWGVGVQLHNKVSCAPFF